MANISGGTIKHVCNHHYPIFPTMFWNEFFNKVVNTRVVSKGTFADNSHNQSIAISKDRKSKALSANSITCPYNSLPSHRLLQRS